MYAHAVVDIFGDVCTYGFLYSVGQVAGPGIGPGSVHKDIKCKKSPKSPAFVTL